MKSPTYRLPSVPQAKATGASSLFPSACPLQLGQEMLRLRPLPMMLLTTGGCWEMNWFSPFPLYRMPRRKETRPHSAQMESQQVATAPTLTQCHPGWAGNT